MGYRHCSPENWSTLHEVDAKFYVVHFDRLTLTNVVFALLPSERSCYSILRMSFFVRSVLPIGFAIGFGIWNGKGTRKFATSIVHRF